MDLVKKVFLYFFIINVSFGCAEEIHQGVLRNGMRYYIWPVHSWPQYNINPWFNHRVEVALVIRKPKELAYFPMDFFFCDEFISSGQFYDRPFFDSFDMSSDEMLSFTRGGNYDPKQILSYFLDHIRRPLPHACIEKIRKQYNEERKEDNDEYEEKEELDILFASSNDQIDLAYHSLLEPTQMALIVLGHCDPIALKLELENTFGNIEMMNNNYTYSDKVGNKKPVLEISNDAFFEDDVTDRSFLTGRPIYLYYYKADPSFKNQVLTDLVYYLVSSVSVNSGFSIPNWLKHSDCLCSYEQINLSQFNEELFNIATEQLEENYVNENTPNTMRYIDHFLSGISDELEPENGNLLRELEAVTYEDFCQFVRKYILNNL